MIGICPHCGNPVTVNGLGCKPLVIPLKNVLESLVYRNVKAAAGELGCRPSYIFGALMKNGLKFNDGVALRMMSSGTPGRGIIRDRQLWEWRGTRVTPRGVSNGAKQQAITQAD